MLLTRGACYCLIATKHLAEHAGEGVSSANDLAEIYGLPHQGLAKMLQRLAAAGLLLSHHGTKGGYTLARSARHISVFDVIKASEGPREGYLRRTPAVRGVCSRLSSTAYGAPASRRFIARAYDR
jgi:Rrf2 family protein